MDSIKKEFVGLNATSVYDVPKKKYSPFEEEKTVSRHGKFKN
jgi:hypothetical protein